MNRLHMSTAKWTEYLVMFAALSFDVLKHLQMSYDAFFLEPMMLILLLKDYF